MKKENITESNLFEIRYTKVEDAPFLKKWLLEPHMLKFFSMADEKEVDEMLNIWIGFSRFKCSLTACFEGKPCGIATLFLFPYIKLVHESLVNLIVDPEMHRKGVGTALVRNIEHLGKNYFRFEKLAYEIYGKNPLVELLQSQGYKVIFKQEHYIKEESGEYKPRTFMEKNVREPSHV